MVLANNNHINDLKREQYSFLHLTPTISQNRNTLSKTPIKRKLQVGTILEVLEYKLARQNGRAQSLKLRPPTLTFRKKNKNKNKFFKMDYEGQDSFLDARGDKKQPSVTRPVQVKKSL